MGDQRGMGKGDWTEAAKQIMANDPPGKEVYISDTVNKPHGNHTDAYRAVKRSDGSVKLKKYKA